MLSLKILNKTCFLRQKDGYPLKWGPKYKIGKEGSTAILVVENADTSDVGNYTCNLYNDAGKASCVASLKVEGEERLNTC